MEKLNQIVFSENTIGGGESRSIRFDESGDPERESNFNKN